MTFSVFASNPSAENVWTAHAIARSSSGDPDSRWPIRSVSAESFSYAPRSARAAAMIFAAVAR
jgi:hypothetical protein